MPTQMTGCHLHPSRFLHPKNVKAANVAEFLIFKLGGGFKYFLCSPLLGEMVQFDDHIFSNGWGENHQLARSDPTKQKEKHTKCSKGSTFESDDRWIFMLGRTFCCPWQVASCFVADVEDLMLDLKIDRYDFFVEQIFRGS